MAHELHCPSCGFENPAGSSTCSQCNFPLHEGTPQPVTPSGSAAERASAPAPMPQVDIRRMRPIRPRRPSDSQQQLQMQLIVVLGGMAVVGAILTVAWQGYQKNNAPAPAVEGASPQQLADIALARNQIQADSTNINAQIALANTLFDTANWPEAIIHYKTALRLDPTRVTTVVDLGVCYFNLSDQPTAESLFTRALTLDPRQPVALFNLGIVAESRNEPAKALDFLRRALQANPPEGMVKALNDAIQRVSAKTGQAAPPKAGGGSPSPGGGF